MTLSVVRQIQPATGLENAAEKIANMVASDSSPRWGCAFHHAIDLLMYARGLRTTTRCLSNYVPNETETQVEQLLAKKSVFRGMREKIH